MVYKLKKIDFLNEFWAFIPARSGSVGIKNKNIKKLAGVPLLAYSIKTALNCKKIKKVIFSSDSDKYINIAKNYGCKHFHKRGKKVSSDTASELSVFQDYIKKRIQENKSLPKYFIHLRPTTPIRKTSTILNGIELFLSKKKNFSSMRSVSLMSEPAYRFFRILNNRLCSINKKDFIVDNYCKPRAYYSKTYKCNCIVDIYKTSTILENKLFGRKVLPFLVNDFINDIDDRKDLKYTEYFIKESKFKI